MKSIYSRARRSARQPGCRPRLEFLEDRTAPTVFWGGFASTPQHTAQAAAILGPSKWLAVEQKVTLETDPAKARALGRKELSRYMVLPNYRNSWLRQGFTEAELADGGSDRFIDAMVLWGDAETISAGCGRTSRPAPRMSVCSLSTPTAISPLATACWPRSPIPERVYGASPQSRSATALR